MTTRTCPRCGGENIVYQREQTVTVGGSKHSFGGGIAIKKGLTYWLLIGWWAWIFKAMFNVVISCCTLGLFKFKKKEKIKGNTVSASKTINQTVAVCQNCGHSWKV